MTHLKTGNGIYYTTNNPFEGRAFARWARAASLPAREVLEPFAGGNFLIEALREMGLCRDYQSYDLYPGAGCVKRRDTLASFPQGFDVCVTNPPWLAKNSATAKGLPWPDTAYDDLYKLALDKCLTHCGYVAALVPESFIRAGVFRDRLTDFISLTRPMFEDTGHPVGLALFAPPRASDAASHDVMVWQDDTLIGELSELEALRPKAERGGGIQVRFNQPDGNVGLIALDNTIGASIRFCDVAELDGYQVKHSSRSITKISVDGAVRIDDWNECLNAFRQETQDVLLTCYKGIRKDGKYRRRLDWDTARGIINQGRGVINQGA